jgi:Ca2+-binding RTX toxin-like protein
MNTLNTVNQSPTDLVLSATNIDENVVANTVIGTFSSTDPNTGNTFTYELVGGEGSTDNGDFTISGNQLQIIASPDFETKPSYSIRVRTTDNGGLTFEKFLTISVNDLNEITGTAGNNTLTGTANDDYIDGGAGNDTLIGGAGNDTYIVDSTTDTITENANEGTDTVRSSVTYTLAANVENLTLTGTAAMVITPLMVVQVMIPLLVVQVMIFTLLIAPMIPLPKMPTKVQIPFNLVLLTLLLLTLKT